MREPRCRLPRALDLDHRPYAWISNWFDLYLNLKSRKQNVVRNVPQEDMCLLRRKTHIYREVGAVHLPVEICVFQAVENCKRWGNIGNSSSFDSKEFCDSNKGWVREFLRCPLARRWSRSGQGLDLVPQRGKGKENHQGNKRSNVRGFILDGGYTWISCMHAMFVRWVFRANKSLWIMWNRFLLVKSVKISMWR